MTTTPTTAGTRAEGARDYAADLLPTATRADSLRYDYLRTEIDMLAAETHQGHNEIRSHELGTRTLEKSKKDAASLLTELAYDRGMSWSDIAELAGVSVSAVRKWRNGGAASPESRGALARIAAMLDLLEHKGAVGDPAVWMEMNLPFEEQGHYIRPLDLYLQGHHVALLDIAERRKDVSQVLDELTPGWRRQRSDFEVYTDVDGQRSIRVRGH